jgi:hypothetical protein
MKRYVIALMAVLLSVGAFAQKTTVNFHDTQARALETTTVSHVKPLIVEVEVTPERVSLENLWLSDEDVKSMNGDVANIRSWATFQCAKNYGADVIVAPMYEIKSDATRGGYNVTVVGFIGKFKNWRSITDADYEWVRMENTWKTSDREKVEAIVKK